MSIVIVPTIAMERGDVEVVQCMTCGCIAAIPVGRWRSRKNPLGQCPVCGMGGWKRQTLPVGGLHSSDEVQS